MCTDKMGMSLGSFSRGRKSYAMRERGREMCLPERKSRPLCERNKFHILSRWPAERWLRSVEVTEGKRPTLQLINNLRLLLKREVDWKMNCICIDKEKRHKKEIERRKLKTIRVKEDVIKELKSRTT